MMGYKKETILQRIYRGFYSLFLMLALPLLLLLFRKKLKMQSSQQNRTRRFAERFGSVPNTIKGGGIVVHCVSMGELNASLQLIKRLQQESPLLPITVTTTSTTGALHAYDLYKDSVQHLFLPIDLPFFMARFLNKLSPKLVLITEVEVWPNLLRLCTKRNVPVCLINARLSDESLPNYQKLSFLLRPALRQFDMIGAQSQSAYDNFKKMGVYKHQLRLTLNMKFDLQPSPEDEKKAAILSQQYQLNEQAIWLAASTHAPEEKFVLGVFSKLLQVYPDLRLVIVPRHPHRFDDVYLLAKATGLSVARLSDDRSADSQVLIVDNMGWLKACYQLCDIAFIGGSIAPKGGHNALECAMYGKPMIMGHSVFNNPEIVEMLVNQGAMKLLENEQQCFEHVSTLFAEPQSKIEKGLAGMAALNSNRGAVELTHQQLTRFL